MLLCMRVVEAGREKDATSKMHFEKISHPVHNLHLRTLLAYETQGSSKEVASSIKHHKFISKRRIEKYPKFARLSRFRTIIDVTLFKRTFEDAPLRSLQRTASCRFVSPWC